MVVAPGEKLHIITRPLFDADVRRHFLGEVVAANETVVRIQGYVFVYDAARRQYVRRPELRTRILGLGDGSHIVKVLPFDVSIESLTYRLGPDGSLTLTDGKAFAMDLNEFLPR